MRNREEFESYVREIAEHKIAVRKRVMRTVASLSAVIVIGLGAFAIIRIAPGHQNKTDVANEMEEAAGAQANGNMEMIAESEEFKAGMNGAVQDGIKEDSDNRNDCDVSGSTMEKYRRAVIKNLSDGCEITLNEEEDIEKLCDAFSTWTEWDEAGFHAAYSVELYAGNKTQTVLISADSVILYENREYLIPGIADKVGEFINKAD